MAKKDNAPKVIKVERKVDVKQKAKNDLSAMFVEFLEEKGIEVCDNHADYGFTKGTLLASMKDTDVQIKLITPRAGLDRYQKVVYEYVDEDAEVESKDKETKSKDKDEPKK